MAQIGLVDLPPASASVPTNSVSPFAPKSRVARLKTYWIEDGAVSLNGRQYPREAVDQLLASAQRTLTDPNALPLTCYISHDAADQDDSTRLCGKIVEVGRDGTRGYAWIDLADTEAGRTMASLAGGGYIRSQSLRAEGAEVKTTRGAAYPQVGGANLTLRGIDFTTTPGLEQVARIAEVVFESFTPTQITQEVFAMEPDQLTLDQEATAPLHEEAIAPTMSGVITGVTSDLLQSDHGGMPAPVVALADMLPEGVGQALSEAHDRSAAMLGMECAPGHMKEAVEAGRTISQKNAAHLVAIHNAAAKASGKSCEATPPQRRVVPLDDDEDNNMESMKKTSKESETMTPEEMLQALREQGYTVEAPKSEAEKLQERVNALEKLITEKLTPASTVAAQEPAQRKSVVEGARLSEPGNPRRKSFVKERLDAMSDAQFAALADRTQPLPADIDPERLLREMQLHMTAAYEQKFGLA